MPTTRPSAGADAPTGASPAFDHSIGAARLAIVAAALAIGLLLSLHLLKPDLDPSRRMLSEYAIGAHGWVMALAFLAMGTSFIALIAALRRHVRTAGGRIGLWLLALASAGLILAGLFPMDPATTPPEQATLHGRLHGAAALLGVPTTPIAALLISYSLVSSSEWRSARPRLLVPAHLIWIALVGMVASLILALSRAAPGLHAELLVGWFNRTFVIAYLCWAISAALQALKLARSAAASG